MIHQDDINAGRCYWFGTVAGSYKDRNVVVKRTGIPLKGFKLGKDGKPVRDEKKYDLCTQLKRARSPRKKFQAVKPAERDFRG